MGTEEGEFHTYVLDKSELKVPVRLDELTGQKFIQIPDLEERKVYTASGLLWVSVVQDRCPHYESYPSDEEGYHDCGSCRFLRTQRAGDIIGICLCEQLGRNSGSK
ncbi:MAG: hypothetical protein RRY64_06585 [Oscillospiraceae bacterium]